MVGDDVLVGDEERRLQAIVTDGSEHWTVDDGAFLGSSPAVAGGYAFMVAGYRAQANDPSNGEVGWMKDLGDVGTTELTVDSSPLIRLW